MGKSRCVLLVGGHDAGKSNFLFRLWMTLQTETGCLVRDGMPADAEYLNAGLAALQSGKFAGRTSREVHKQNLIPVRSTGGDAFHGELVVPDCSGEQWMKIHRNREWDERWESVIPSLAGCLLFIRAGSGEIRPRLDWVGYAGLYDSTPEQVDGENAVDLPTEVVLIDWLQCLARAVAERGRPGTPLRVGVVVTAWDRVPADQQKVAPSAYVAANFAMFFHFAESNADWLDFEFFGTSVAGGDLEATPGFRDEYLEGRPEASGYVFHTIGGQPARSADYSLPVAWAMGLHIGNAQSGANKP